MSCRRSTFRFLQKILKFEEGVDIWPLIRSLREAKSEYELGLLRKAGEIGAEVYREVAEFIRPGLAEIEVAGWMNYLAMRRGHQNILRSRGFNSEIYNWHVVSGAWGTLPSSIDAPFNGVGLSPAFPLGAGLKPDRRRGTDADRFRDLLYGLPGGPDPDVFHRETGNGISGGL